MHLFDNGADESPLLFFREIKAVEVIHLLHYDGLGSQFRWKEKFSSRCWLIAIYDMTPSILNYRVPILFHFLIRTDLMDSFYCKMSPYFRIRSCEGNAKGKTSL